MTTQKPEVVKATEVMLKWVLERLNELENNNDRYALYEEFIELIQNYYGYKKIDEVLYTNYLNEEEK